MISRRVALERGLRAGYVGLGRLGDACLLGGGTERSDQPW